MDIITANIGQGELAIVRHNNEALIIDTKIPKNSNNDVIYVKGFLASHLKDHYVRGIILTGFDKDHSDADGVGIVLHKYRPDWIMYPKYYKDSESASDVFDIIKDFEKEHKELEKSFNRISVCLDEKYKCELNSLTKNFTMRLFSPHTSDMNSSNNSSIVLKITGQGLSGFSYLVTGDTENDRWDTINRIFGSSLKSDVLSAPHHGSINGLNPESLLNIQPNTVLISAGVNNQYGHPDSRALAVYDKVAKHVFSTNKPNGASLYTRLEHNDFVTTRF